MRTGLIRIELGIVAALLGTGCVAVPFLLVDAARLVAPPPRVPDPRSLSQAEADRVNAVVKGKEGAVTIAGAAGPESLQVMDVTVGRETTRWLELQPGSSQPRPRSVPTAVLQQITVVDRGAGAFAGFGAGGAIGMLAGALVGGAASGSFSRHAGDVANSGPLIGALVGAFAGIGAGTVIGASAGLQRTVEFAVERPDSRLAPASCSPPLVPAVLPSSTRIYAAADTTFRMATVLRRDTPLCLDKSLDALGLHRVQWADGTVGFVLDSDVVSHSDVNFLGRSRSPGPTLAVPG